jgi:hypothetical protein
MSEYRDLISRRRDRERQEQAKVQAQQTSREAELLRRIALVVDACRENAAALLAASEETLQILKIHNETRIMSGWKKDKWKGGYSHERYEVIGWLVAETEVPIYDCNSQWRKVFLLPDGVFFRFQNGDKYVVKFDGGGAKLTRTEAINHIRAAGSMSTVDAKIGQLFHAAGLEYPGPIV